MLSRNPLTLRLWLSAVLSLLTLSPAWAVVPAKLPKPDDTPPSKDKPVKIYIMSGQSNMLGFGSAEGGSPHHSSIYLSADPRVKPGKMPVGSSAILPHHVFQDTEGKTRGAKVRVYAGDIEAVIASKTAKPAIETTIALGKVDERLPSIEGEHIVIVDGFIEVPMTGPHTVHAGFGDSSHAIVTIHGKEVYRKEVGGEAVITKVNLEKAKRHPIKIIYLKGGAASFWMERVDMKIRGNLRDMVNQGRFQCLIDEDGKWTVRNDVILNNAYMGKGQSTPLTPKDKFGPELGFGYVMGTSHDEPVILMKADIGNRSLAWDILPPGSQRYQVGDTMYAGYKDGQSSWPVEQGEPEKGGWYAGKQYDDYTAAIHRELGMLDEKYPQFKDQGFEVAGFVWWQGHKDQNEVHASRYEHNLVNLIKAWRKEFNAPDAKWVIATIAFGGWELDGPGKTIAEAQLAVSDWEKYPQFKGNVMTIEARPFWRDPGESPKNQGYHYHHNGETYFLVGDALGRAMVELHGGKAEKRTLSPRPEIPDEWPENPTLDQAARMIYTNDFLAFWMRGPAEPTPEDFEKMAPALRPMVLGGLIPSYVAQAVRGVPAYRRRGAPLVPLVTGETNAKPPHAGLSIQFDTIIEYYNAAGMHDYDWKPFTPGMRTAAWNYFSFDPPEAPGEGVRYREITLPEGMENWYAVDFDPAKAGWKTGAAPFGQRDGELKPLSDNCNNPQCRCDEEPNTLWEHEVLLMRQTFEIPPLKADRRYRLIVGGGSHAFTGEGYAVYVNGKLFSEMKSGFYKRGGERGAYIYNDFRPEFESGKVTIAVKGFLRHTRYMNQPAPPTGHLSVWLEQVQLPEVVTERVNAK